MRLRLRQQKNMVPKAERLLTDQNCQVDLVSPSSQAMTALSDLSEKDCISSNETLNGCLDQRHVSSLIQLQRLRKEQTDNEYENGDHVPLMDDSDTGSMEERDAVELIELSAHQRSSSADESSWIIALQVVFPFLIAGCGTVGAGLVLDIVQHWVVFVEVREIFILVPALLGLKGNLEMTLASRLSTHANLGRMDTRKEMISQICGNLALVQAQAMVVAFFASVFAVTLGWIPDGQVSFEHAVVLCASSMATAAAASFVLSCVMICVVVFSRRFHVNPDNVATPIAASLGDLTTLSLLACIATILHRTKNHEIPVASTLVVILLLLTPVWMWISYKNAYTKPVLLGGWTPVLFSMLISSAGGFILDITVAAFRGIAVFQPVINGIGGNLVAVQASRLSTWLHKHAVLGQLPHGTPIDCPTPCYVFCEPRVHSRAARVLLMLVVPGQLLFMYMIHFLKAGHTTITPLFTVIYLSAALLQVALLLYICAWMVNYMWRKSVDPDNSAIPYLTALGDLLGTAFLAISFHILYLLGDKDSDVGE